MSLLVKEKEIYSVHSILFQPFNSSLKEEGLRQTANSAPPTETVETSVAIKEQSYLNGTFKIAQRVPLTRIYKQLS